MSGELDFNTMSFYAREHERLGHLDDAQSWRDHRWLVFPHGPGTAMRFLGAESTAPLGRGDNSEWYHGHDLVT